MVFSYNQEGSKSSNGYWTSGVQPLLGDRVCKVRVVSPVLVRLDDLEEEQAADLRRRTRDARSCVRSLT